MALDAYRPVAYHVDGCLKVWQDLALRAKGRGIEINRIAANVHVLIFHDGVFRVSCACCVLDVGILLTERVNQSGGSELKSVIGIM